MDFCGYCFLFVPSRAIKMTVTVHFNFVVVAAMLNADQPHLLKLCKFKGLKPRPNEYNISYNIIQLWCFMKCCTRLATLLYRVLSCCILLYEVWSRSNFSLNKCCTIQHFFCFPRCCMMLYSFGHPMQLCCTLLYSRVRSRSNFPATFLCWLCFWRHV